MVLKRSDRFAARESGAAAFDWVILAVGVVGLGLAAFSVFTADWEDRARAPHVAAEQSAPTGIGLPPLYPYFNEIWQQDQAAYYAALSDEALLADYAAQYSVAMGEVNARIGADILAVIEQEMTRRGLAVPDGNETAAEIRNRLSGATSSP